MTLSPNTVAIVERDTGTHVCIRCAAALGWLDELGTSERYGECETWNLDLERGEVFRCDYCYGFIADGGCAVVIDVMEACERAGLADVAYWNTGGGILAVSARVPRTGDVVTIGSGFDAGLDESWEAGDGFRLLVGEDDCEGSYVPTLVQLSDALDRLAAAE